MSDRYQVGDEVEVLLPDGWLRGTVREVRPRHFFDDREGYRVDGEKPRFITHVSPESMRRVAA